MILEKLIDLEKSQKMVFFVILCGLIQLIIKVDFVKG